MSGVRFSNIFYNQLLVMRLHDSLISLPQPDRTWILLSKVGVILVTVMRHRKPNACREIHAELGTVSQFVCIDSDAPGWSWIMQALSLESRIRNGLRL